MKLNLQKIYSLNSTSSVWIEIAMPIRKTPNPHVFRASSDLYNKICGKQKIKPLRIINI